MAHSYKGEARPPKPGSDFQSQRRKARAGKLHGTKPKEARGAEARGVTSASAKSYGRQSVLDNLQTKALDVPKSYNPSAPQFPLKTGKFGFKNPLKN